MKEASRWLRVGAICSQLHVLPRSGGVLEQPHTELARLEKILEVFGRYRDYKDEKGKTRNRNRGRHEPKRFREVTP